MNVLFNVPPFPPRPSRAVRRISEVIAVMILSPLILTGLLMLAGRCLLDRFSNPQGADHE